LGTLRWSVYSLRVSDAGVLDFCAKVEDDHNLTRPVSLFSCWKKTPGNTFGMVCFCRVSSAADIPRHVGLHCHLPGCCDAFLRFDRGSGRLHAFYFVQQEHSGYASTLIIEISGATLDTVGRFVSVNLVGQTNEWINGNMRLQIQHLMFFFEHNSCHRWENHQEGSTLTFTTTIHKNEIFIRTY
jgi:hypothetical protein